MGLWTGTLFRSFKIRRQRITRSREVEKARVDNGTATTIAGFGLAVQLASGKEYGSLPVFEQTVIEHDGVDGALIAGAVHKDGGFTVVVLIHKHLLI